MPETVMARVSTPCIKVCLHRPRDGPLRGLRPHGRGGGALGLAQRGGAPAHHGRAGGAHAGGLPAGAQARDRLTPCRRSGVGLLLFAAALLVFHYAPDRLAGLPAAGGGDPAGARLPGLPPDAGGSSTSSGSASPPGSRPSCSGASRSAGSSAPTPTAARSARRRRACFGEVGPEPTATVGPGGEVTVPRRADGSFVVPARVNDRELRFIFDTGATTVVLTAESAAAIGIDLSSLVYVVPGLHRERAQPRRARHPRPARRRLDHGAARARPRRQAGRAAREPARA